MGTLDQSATVTNSTVTTHTLSNLSSGQWYVAVYAVNGAGMESPISDLWTKTIQ